MNAAFRPLSRLFDNQCSNVCRTADHIVSYDGPELRYDWQTFTDNVVYTYQQLKQTPAKRIAICCIDSYFFTVGFSAACLAGKHLILPGNYQPEALSALSDQFDLLLCDDLFHPPENLVHQRITTQTTPTSFHSAFQLPEIKPEETAITMFTSGSSGTPKAIAKTLHQLETEVATLERLWGEHIAGSVIESTVSHQHIYGLLFRILWPLCSGRAFSARNLEYPEQIINRLSADTTLISSPAMLKRFPDGISSASARAVFSSGGPLSFATAVQINRLLGHYPVEIFGSTETGGIAYRQQYQDGQLWTLFPDIQAHTNHEGCLCLLSPHVTPDLWYQSSDICQFHSQRQFELKGRTDRIVKIEEKRVSLSEVEQCIDNLKWIQESTVISLQEEKRLILAAMLVLSPQGEQQLLSQGKGRFWIQLRQELRQWLEPVVIPKRFRVVHEIPVNSQGKKQLSEIRKHFETTPGNQDI
ncbi:AMP-binding protein [Vibrio mangrovi]|uniref:3-hydroxybenzoate--CoA/4-hydroxybenzoate--CoA ligase n=1 Tax=Vibrio mangrovi TaxID=474394 RepID=A0A1Y6IR53_9VIBR|nr:AMP-binding protein [Vibrio mangrovi]MDW6001849.1 AMP-binding protein [Vibrio mangrovi]SMS00124.1 3-hydroxybenzoate--CoA/4-hydroxybenzoate--CoA ligase [Vibrio mangrovi]